MSEGFIKTLETKIDTNKNLKLEEQEILDFIKQEENLQALGKELQNICHQSPDRLGNF